MYIEMNIEMSNEMIIEMNIEMKEWKSPKKGYFWKINDMQLRI